jgi:hypothetical protein
MPAVAPDDWAAGIAGSLRQLLDAGANDDELWRFIQARHSGDDHAANLVLASTRSTRQESMPSDLGYELDAVVNQLTVAALRPVVNVLDVRLLRQYVHDVQLLSEHIVRTTEGESYWLHESYVATMAEVVRRIALDRAK